ncbi:MAG: hypothetical protein Q8O99_00995 [bacterium]|nr:hypothetical protein [bacterium]
MQVAVMKPHTHFDTLTSQAILYAFSHEISATEASKQLNIRKATLLAWYTYFRKLLYSHVQTLVPPDTTSGYLWLRRKQYLPKNQKKMYTQKVYIIRYNHKIRAVCKEDIGLFTILPITSLQQQLTDNYYVHHRKHIDEIVPVTTDFTANDVSIFFTSLPQQVISFVQYSKEMIKQAHGIPIAKQHLHLAERVSRYNEKNPQSFEELLTNLCLQTTS